MGSRRFVLRVPDAEVEELRRRVQVTRWATPVPGAGWEAGTDPAELRRLAEYWADGYDWRAHEAAINELPGFVTDIGGADVHYLRFDAERPDALPLVLTHGWPSTVLELVELARRLSAPSEHGGTAADAFTVIVPALPGFPFSAPRPTFPSDLPTHELWHRLMREELGFERYGAHGGDLGAGVTSRLGESYPDSVVGIHLLAVSPATGVSDDDLDPEERAYLASVAQWTVAEGGYQHEQQTRPMSVAPALADSPVGLLAWIVEKYRAWSDSHGELARRFDDDFVLTQASLYWYGNAISSSFRPYYEFGRGLVPPVCRVEVPTAVAVFPADLSQPPRQWAERVYRVERYTKMPCGGHFAAHEEPQLLADDLTAFFRTLS